MAFRSQRYHLSRGQKKIETLRGTGAPVAGRKKRATYAGVCTGAAVVLGCTLR